jgi:multiple sugar transport system ATP-binding protein
MSALTTNGAQALATGEPAIELVGVSKRYGDRLVIESVDLAIEEGEFLVLLGPSGCGKSTLLKIVSGLEDATGGEVYIGGKLANYTAPKLRDVAMVFQNYALYPHMTVAQNVGFPLKMRGHHKPDVARRVEEVAALLDLTPYLDRHPEQLSGGQRQRVALGRAIVRDPVAFLMDEPLSNLDALLRVQMRDELLRLHRRVGKTTVYVTHDQVEAMTMASRIVVLRDGVVQQVGTPEAVYEQPANVFVATFVGSPQMNLFAGRLEPAGEERTFVAEGFKLPAGVGEVAAEATLGIRPTDLELAPESGDTLPAEVTLVEFVGADLYVHVALPGDAHAVARIPVGARPSEGEHVHIRLRPERFHLFGADGIRLGTDTDTQPAMEVETR